jgi:hypothetical protein
MDYTDEFLNYWGEIYCRAQLVEHKLPFATFIKDPWKWILQFGVDDAKLPQLRDKPLTRKPSRAKMVERNGRVGRVPAKVYDLAAARKRREEAAQAAEERDGTLT